MILNIKLGMVIATRELITQNGETVLIEIGKPELQSDAEDFVCPFRITGLGDSRVLWSPGVDSLQAVFLALQKILLILQASMDRQGGRLTWVDGGENFGFPLFTI